MFEYFPGNYVWNLAVVAALNSGGLIDEVDRACRPIREAAARGEDAGTKDFLAAWTGLTDQLEELAEDAAAAGHSRTAGELYFRATNYLCNAERMQSASSPGRLEVYRRVLRLAQQAMEHRDPQVTRVAVPYEDTSWLASTCRTTRQSEPPWTRSKRRASRILPARSSRRSYSERSFIMRPRRCG